MWGQRGTWGCKKFVTAKQGVYPKGDTFRGILELQLEAAVLELMVFGGTEKREWVGVSRIVRIWLKVGQKLVNSLCTCVLKVR